MEITRKIIKTILIIYVLSVAIGCGKNEPPAPNEFLFKVQSFIGDVKITGERGDIQIKQGDLLNINDIIITGDKSFIDILYGSSGVVRVNENSKVSIAAIPDKDNNSAVLNMEKGKVLVALAKLKKTDFNVKTPTLVAAVRGTSFSVVNDKSGAKVSVLKGTVAAQPVKDGNIIENKAVDVDASFRTDYVNEATVNKITAENKKISVVKMTTAETTEILSEAENFKESVNKIEDLSAQEKKDVEKELTVGNAHPPQKARGQRKANTTNNTITNAAKQEAQKLQDAAAKKAKEEQTKKERVSNIPTM